MSDQSADQASHSYFVPMIDMLAGVVFILVIMLAAVSLVQRDDFRQASSMQAEISKIEAKLAEARQLEVTYLDPRKTARAALILLLQRLHDQLAASGIASEPLPDEGQLVIQAPDIFAPGQANLSETGAKVTSVLAGAMIAEVPCLTPKAPATANCGAYNHAHLDDASIVVSDAGPAGAQRDARALLFLSAMAVARPELLAQKAIDGRKLLDYQSSQSLPATTATSATGSTPAEPAPERVSLAFRMNVPPLPR